MDKKFYTPPELLILGDVASITRGSWIGMYDHDDDWTQDRPNERFSMQAIIES